jgi:predicted deacylase
MESSSTKRMITIVSIVGVIVVVAIIFVFLNKKAPEVVKPVVTAPVEVRQEVIGHSVEGRDIESYTYGNGSTTLMFVGGVHGGYEWNSVVLAYSFMDYLKANPTIVPKNLTISVIPNANPDGVYKVIGKEGRFTAEDVPTTKLVAGTGRFNTNGVDLNRNFDCNWKAKSMWQNKVVSAGTKAFSEPEAATIRDFVLKNKPVAGIFWHSAANAVYASECNGGILPQTLDLMNAYSKSAGYASVKTFDAYAVTGDAEGWMASIKIPAITVELSSHDTVEWNKNLAGILAVLKYYGN